MANCNKQQLNITCGTDVVLHDTLIFGGETFDPALSVGITANLVSSIGKRTALEVEVADGGLIIYVPWVERNAGYYGLEVTGICNSKKWATYADSLIRYTKATRIGVSEVTVESDSYDITQEVGYRYSTSPIDSVIATVDDQVGTPSVDVTYEQRVLSMAFHNLKGDPMNFDDLTPAQKEELKGEPGDSAIFDPSTGNISAMKQTTGNDTLSPMSQKAVTEEVKKLTAVDYDSDVELQISDGGGNVIAKFSKGNFETQCFNSKQVCKQSTLSDSDLDIGDPNGNVILRIKGGDIETKNFNSAGLGKKNVTGKQIIIERFGGDGNDWSFVRTPSTYNLASKPFRWVILNHGNGWVMDGSEEKANFSSKTQFGVDTQNSGAYMDTTRPDYVKYSSPLIEALLSAGYVVCGCENYGDGLYGNDNCRNAIVDFFDYMRANYNLSERCHMVGASNGCLASLNACHLLGAGKVASIALLYPLCSLFDQYLHYSNHRAGILSAYGLTGHTYSTLADLKAEKTFYTHCPVHHYIVGDDAIDEQTKTLAFPPMIIYASGGDQVVDINYNAKKLQGLCERSALVCKLTDIDPGGVNGYGHGDWHHFQESNIVNFFNANK